MPTSNRTSSDRRAARRAKMSPTQLLADNAKLAEKKRRQRFRHYFAREYGRFPEGADDAKDVRRMMRGHPPRCSCWDCLWSPEECGETVPRVATVGHRLSPIGSGGSHE